jgi:hypothetical protein
LRRHFRSQFVEPCRNENGTPTTGATPRLGRREEIEKITRNGPHDHDLFSNQNPLVVELHYRRVPARSVAEIQANGIVGAGRRPPDRKKSGGAYDGPQVRIPNGSEDELRWIARTEIAEELDPSYCDLRKAIACDQGPKRFGQPMGEESLEVLDPRGVGDGHNAEA